MAQVEIGGIGGEEEADVFAQKRVALDGGASGRAGGGDGDFLIFEGDRLLQGLEVLQVEETFAVHWILDHLIAVGKDGGLINAPETAGGINRAREKGQAFGQV